MMFSFRIDADIELRLLEERHAKPLFELTDKNREYLARWLPWVEHTEEVDDTLNFIRRVRRAYAENEFIPTGIWFDGRLVGALGLKDIDWRIGRAEIGYWLDEEHQGRGIMTRACRGIIEAAFDELGLNRIIIRCHPENAKSSAIPRRLGFRHEGTHRQCEKFYDELVDMEVYALLRSEWETSR